jgi:uncharacterized membrane protein YuzA (DUF378 family)
MEFIKRLEPLALFVMFLGALDWGILGLFHDNLLGDAFGTGTGLDVAYTVIGVAGLVWVPRLLEMAHIDMHRMRPHGA